MGETGFWDNQEQAASISAEHARTKRKLETFRTLAADVEDLGAMVELAEEDPQLEAEVGDQIASAEERLAALEEIRKRCAGEVPTPALEAPAGGAR